MNGDEFFTATPQLQTIYRWARARYAAPWAVFGAVLLRVSASVGPQVQLPGLIGGRASLNLLCAFVSASGGGKGISDKVARLAWPKAILELPIGSGEGIAATFKRPDKEGENNEAISAAIFNVPEVDTLAGIASRQGSILLAQLKSMAMGEQIGQQNASKATTRVVAAHAYRCCLSVGAQPGHTGVLFDDATGGTPQRFLWFPTTDASMPSEAAPDPPSSWYPTWSAPTAARPASAAHCCGTAPAPMSSYPTHSDYSTPSNRPGGPGVKPFSMRGQGAATTGHFTPRAATCAGATTPPRLRMQC